MLDFRMSKNKQAQEQIKMKRSSLPYGLPQYRRKVPTVTGITDPTNVEKNRDLTQAEVSISIMVHTCMFSNILHIYNNLSVMNYFSIIYQSMY